MDRRKLSSDELAFIESLKTNHRVGNLPEIDAVFVETKLSPQPNLSPDQDWLAEWLKIAINPYTYAYEIVPDEVTVADDGQYYGLKTTDTPPTDWEQEAIAALKYFRLSIEPEIFSAALDKLEPKDKSQIESWLNSNPDTLSDKKSDTIRYTLIEDDESLKDAIASFEKEKVIAIDTETTGLDPHLHKLRLIQIASENNPTLIIDCFKCDPNLIQPLLINDSIKVFHNAKFDLQFFLALGLEINQKIFDTQLAYQLINAGKDNLKYSLKAVAKELLNEELNKEEQVSDWKSDKLTDNQLTYASKDAEILLPLREKLREAIIEANLSRVAKIEFDCVLAVAEIELNGMLLHREKWQSILKDTEIKKQKVEVELKEILTLPSEEHTLFEIKRELNLDSPNQVLEALNHAGIKVENTNAKTLKKHLAHSEIKLLLEYKKLAKILSSFGEGMIKKINPVSGRLHGSYNQLRTESGRFTCIAEGQKVQVVGGEKNIEDVKVGDYVYCYTDEGKLTAKKVLNVYDNGIRDVVRVNWQSVGVKGREKGYLICTPDHLIKTVNLGWVEAQDLTKGDKVYHLRRTTTYFNITYSNHRIINVVPNGMARVFDLEVEDCHNFIANEICVHNCGSPNLQQIPRNKEARSCFVSQPGYKLVVADYSQIELRIAAELTDDRKMIEAYNRGEDLHKLTASIILDKPLQEITKEDRQIAKSANFGLIYAASVTGFRSYAESNYSISLSENEAQNIRDNFFKSYQGLAKWHKSTKSRLYNQGITETRTLSGRRRLFDKPTPQQVLNTPVQGLGADMLKLALARLPQALKGLDAKILATVHDEIILEASEEIADQVASILSEVMVSAGKEFLTKVPVEAEASIGDSWADKQ